jgi:uncharacterized membrane protein YkvA (DUF1232 family)
MSESSLKVSFELSVSDVKYFRSRLKCTRTKREESDNVRVIEGAASHLDEAFASDSPEFVTLRLQKLEMLIEMSRDTDWRLEGRDRARVLDALAYFADPDDMIEDRLPGIGYLDDAIMIELVVRELKHEIKAYEEFCDYKSKPNTDKIEARRKALQTRMRRRRRSEISKLRAPGAARSPLRLW